MYFSSLSANILSLIVNRYKVTLVHSDSRILRQKNASAIDVNFLKMISDAYLLAESDFMICTMASVVSRSVTELDS